MCGICRLYAYMNFFHICEYADNARIRRYILMREDVHQEGRFTEPVPIASGSLNPLLLMDLSVVFFYIFLFICIIYTFTLAYDFHFLVPLPTSS